jgi:hypothetical protein
VLGWLQQALLPEDPLAAELPLFKSTMGFVRWGFTLAFWHLGRGSAYEGRRVHTLPGRRRLCSNLRPALSAAPSAANLPLAALPQTPSSTRSGEGATPTQTVGPQVPPALVSLGCGARWLEPATPAAGEARWQEGGR